MFEPTLRERAALSIYSGLHALVMPALLPLCCLHPRLKGGMLQRLGRPDCAREGTVWFHGASAGDVAALLPLVERIGRPAVVSTWTASGAQMGTSLNLSSAVIRVPFDLAVCVRSAMRRLRPSLLVLECLEMWPRLVRCAAAAGIPVAIVNGRLSPSSLAAYRRLPSLFGGCFRRLGLVAATTQEHAARFAEAGVLPERIVVAGSSKHALDAGLPPPIRPRERKLVLGSLHEAEADRLLPRLPELFARLPGLSVVVAPRYPGAARRWARRLTRLGLHPVRSAVVSRQHPLLVVDRMGALADHYAGASVAFVGGSLVNKGGHNVVEAAARGAPVLVGPHHENCRSEVRHLAAAGGLDVISSVEDFVSHTSRLLSRPRLAQVRSRAAWHAAGSLHGDADRIAVSLKQLLRNSRPQRPGHT